MPVYPFGYGIISGKQDGGTTVTNVINSTPVDSLAIIANTSKTGSLTTVTTDPIDTTGATMIIVAVAQNNPVTGALTDSIGNAPWTELPESIQANVITSFFYFLNPVTSAAHTFTFSGALTAAAIAVVAISGNAASPIDQQNGEFNNGPSIQPGSVTPTQDSELVLFAVGNSGGSGPSVDSGFSILESIDYTTGNNYGIALGVLLPATTISYNPLMSYSAAPNALSARILTIKHA